MILVDTSALYALLDEDDNNHLPAVLRWRALLPATVLATHSYVIIETTALVQRRLGMDAAERLHAHLLPAVTTVMVDQLTHERAVERWRASARRRLSLVDVTSFVVMADRQISTALAFDEDFEAAGFALFSPGDPSAG